MYIKQIETLQKQLELYEKQNEALQKQLEQNSVREKENETKLIRILDLLEQSGVSPKPKTAKLTKNWDKPDQTKLSKGDIVMIIDDQDKNWWKVKSNGGEELYVHSSVFQ